MEEKGFHLEIINIDHILFTGQVQSLQLPALEGELGILPGHLPLLVQVRPGLLKLMRQGETEILYSSGGVLEFRDNRAIFLSDQVIRGEELESSEASSVQLSVQQGLYGYFQHESNHLDTEENFSKILSKLRSLKLSHYPQKRRGRSRLEE